MPEDDIDRLRSQLKALHRRMRREQSDVEGLSGTTLEVLIAIDGAHGAIQPTRIGADLQMASPNVAAALRSLEASGLVARRKDPEDGRKSLVEITEQGRKVIAEARLGWRSWLRDTIESTLTVSERTLLFKAGDLMQRLADDDPASRAATSRLRRTSRASVPD